MDAGPPPLRWCLLYSEIDLHIINPVARIHSYTGEDHLPRFHVWLVVPSPMGWEDLKLNSIWSPKSRRDTSINVPEPRRAPYRW